MIRSMDYATITSRRRVKGSGLSVGQRVLVIGARTLPIKKDDPYLARTFFYVIKVDEDGTHYMPNDGEKDNGERAYLLDPRALSKLPEEEADELRKNYK